MEKKKKKISAWAVSNERIIDRFFENGDRGFYAIFKTKKEAEEYAKDWGPQKVHRITLIY